MKIPRNVYGRELADHLIRHWEYREMPQKDSHIILRTETPSGQTMPIPAHKPLKPGTLAAILRLISAHKQVDRAEILKGL